MIHCTNIVSNKFTAVYLIYRRFGSWLYCSIGKVVIVISGEKCLNKVKGYVERK